LQQRREQMEMMMNWMEELRQFNQTIVDRLCSYWEELAPGVGFSADDEREFKKLLRRYSIDEICSAMNLAADRHIEFMDNGNASFPSWLRAFDSIPAACRVIKAGKMARKST
jgi:hypothetical protein